MLWFLYNALFAVGFSLLLPRFLYRMCRRGGYRDGFMQRLAVYGPELRRALAGRPRCWLHAVSVGEVYVAVRFMEEFRRRDPGAAFVLTTTTSTGHRLAAGLLREPDVLLYFPADFQWVIRRVLAAIRPRALILIEGELWPNLIRGCAARGIPVFLANGRLSARSYRGYRMVRPFFRRGVNLLSRACMQTEDDAARLAKLGVERRLIRVFGSAKYDVALADATDGSAAERALREAGIAPDAPVIVGGSTWPGEETALLDAWTSVREKGSRAVLVLAPRHAERGDEVAAELLRRGLRFSRRSRPGEPAAGGADVLLVDTTGELKGFYAAATVIFVGKSLAAHGGQNPIEPAVYGKPIVVGPNMENFAGVMADFRRVGGIREVADAAGLAGCLRDLLRDSAAAADLGARARRAVENGRGTVARTVDEILQLLCGSDRH